MVGGAGSRCVITNIMYIWYRPLMGNMVRPAGTISVLTSNTYIWYRPIMGIRLGPAITICWSTTFMFIPDCTIFANTVIQAMTCWPIISHMVITSRTILG